MMVLAKTVTILQIFQHKPCKKKDFDIAQKYALDSIDEIKIYSSILLDGIFLIDKHMNIIGEVCADILFSSSVKRLPFNSCKRTMILPLFTR